MESVVIVGPGRLGLSLGAALLRCRAVDQLTFIGRSLEPPPHPLFDSTAAPVEYRAAVQPLPIGTTVLVLAVPDRALAEVAHEIAYAGPAPSGCAALHASGAMAADVLAPLHAAGYSVGSLHPLHSIADPWSGAERLIGGTFALAGEPAAVAGARRIVSALSGHGFIVTARARATYHAAAVMASNYLVTLYETAVRLMADAGVDPDEAAPAISALMRGTLDNLEHLGASAALTGPLARGDAETVRLHLSRLSPSDRALYCALGRATLGIARAAGLDEERAADLERLLTP